MGAKRPPGYQSRLSASHRSPEMATTHCSTNEECWPTVGVWGRNTTTMTAQAEFVTWSTQSKNSSQSHIHWKGRTTHKTPRGPITGALMVVVVEEEVVVVAQGPTRRVRSHQWECASGSAARAASAVGQRSPSIEATTTPTTSSTAQRLLRAPGIGAQTTTWNGS